MILNYENVKKRVSVLTQRREMAVAVKKMFCSAIYIECDLFNNVYKHIFLLFVII